MTFEFSNEFFSDLSADELFLIDGGGFWGGVSVIAAGVGIIAISVGAVIAAPVTVAAAVLYTVGIIAGQFAVGGGIAMSLQGLVR
ncbi:MAG: hypothetical protein LBK23_06095 [Oscillospiraceae bacterium]|jgi:hypothetical protein|nr:hypothetical protein [Oscillospiraceae bacterium]